jgi:hypothetical protein
VAGRLIRITTALAVAAVAAVAAVISYRHAYELVTTHGEMAWRVSLGPLAGEFRPQLAILETLIVNWVPAPPRRPMMAATRRLSTSYVLASLRLHVDLVLAGGKDPTLSG